MRKNIFKLTIFVAALLMTTITNAQSAANLSGVILDKKSGEPVIFEQYPRYIDGNGVIQNRRQVAKSFNPGAGIFLGVLCKF